MLDVAQAFFTAGLAAGFGLTGYFGLRLFAEPILEQRRIRARIGYALTFYANCFAVPGMSDEGVKKLDEASTALRELAARLRESRYSIPCYRWLEKVGLVIKRGAIQSTAAELIGWSNSLYNGDRSERRHRIREYLGIDYDLDVTPGTRDARQLSSTRQSEAA
jgi:hypothetical protein